MSHAMVCKCTSINRPPRRTGSVAGRRAFALTEMMFAIGLTTLLVLVVCGFALYSSRNFAVIANYVELDDANRLAIDFRR